MTGLNVRKISNKLFIENLHILEKSYLSQVRKSMRMQGYFPSYPNDLAICFQEKNYQSFRGPEAGPTPLPMGEKFRTIFLVHPPYQILNEISNALPLLYRHRSDTVNNRF